MALMCKIVSGRRQAELINLPSGLISHCQAGTDQRRNVELRLIFLIHADISIKDNAIASKLKDGRDRIGILG